MHLTNYAIQKKSDAFVKNEDADDDSGHKRSLTQILEYLKQNEAGFNPEELMKEIEDIAAKTVLSV